MDSYHVILSNSGRVESSEMRPGDLASVLKKVLQEAIDKWNFEKSDLSVIRDNYPVPLKLPLKPQQLQLYAKYDLRRESGGAFVTVPVYVVSFDSEVQEEGYLEKRVLVVSPHVDEAVEKEMLEYAADITRPIASAGEAGEADVEADEDVEE